MYMCLFTITTDDELKEIDKTILFGRKISIYSLQLSSTTKMYRLFKWGCQRKLTIPQLHLGGDESDLLKGKG